MVKRGRRIDGGEGGGEEGTVVGSGHVESLTRVKQKGEKGKQQG